MEGGKVEAVMAEGRGALTYSTYSHAMVRYNGLPLALAPVAQPRWLALQGEKGSRGSLAGNGEKKQGKNR